MRNWKHSGFSVDNSVKIEKGDHVGMQRLVEYISRCPLSLSRMVSQAGDGKIIYRTAHPNCIPFPLSGDKTLMKGIPRNFEVFDPLDFLAAVTQHIPDKGDHQIHYFGWYSNKKRGMQLKKLPKKQEEPGLDEPDTPYRRKCRMTWAALIKAVYEVDPLKCPKCGGTMRIISFIEKATQQSVVEKILRHCGLWKEAPPRAPPIPIPSPAQSFGRTVDYDFFQNLAG